MEKMDGANLPGCLPEVWLEKYYGEMDNLW